ncbi:putative Shugoshin-1 [Quillaja saponaria]|uniref:Shugoshin-1 n=1 Tax=Quillaja saponaria TaxID=32244 RepID=A0AAD7QGS2_QUISA|nr:putative Shugoshin-1 [Quillaja saponaria]
MIGEKMSKRSSIGGLTRKKLSDITNSQPEPKLPCLIEKPPENFLSDKDRIEQLLKERMTLMQLIGERTKIIELSGAEMQRLRDNVQKLQLQNWNLAQANSQMLAELKLGREKIKSLQHEVLCKAALLKGNDLKVEGKIEMNNEQTASQSQKEGGEKAGQSLPKAAADEKPCNRNRRHTTRSRSMGPSTTSRKDADKEKVENKRRCLRRQSARFKSHEQEPIENLFEIEDAIFPKTRLKKSMQEGGHTLMSSASVINDENGENHALRSEAPRSSIGRPMRKAVGKVQSYKEVPLNVKMRRVE